MPLRASWSAHALGDKLLASKCGGDATMLRVVSSRVVLLGAPFSGCACLRRPELWARSGLELPSREDDNFDPGTRRGATGGSPPPLLASFAQLFGYQPLPLTCIYLSVRAARLWCSIRTPLQPVRCAHARHRDLNRCFARCRLDAVLRQPHSLAYARLSEAVRLPLDQGISAGRRASCRHARTLVV